MKRLWLLTLLALPVWAVVLPPGTLRTNVNIIVAYNTNSVSTNSTLFKVYGTTNLALPLTSWPVVTNIMLTNAGTGTLTIPFPLTPQVMFFSVTSSNLWGESPFSAVVSTPPAPPDSTVQIQ